MSTDGCSSDEDVFEDASDDVFPDQACATVKPLDRWRVPSYLKLLLPSNVTGFLQRIRSSGDSDDDVFEDAREHPRSSSMDPVLEKAMDAYLAYQGKVPRFEHSQMVHLGNIKYDLSLVNYNQHVKDIEDFLKSGDKSELTKVSPTELTIVSRAEWNAEPAVDILTPLPQPVSVVIVCHTAGLMGLTRAENCHIVQRIQAYHMENLEWDDIGYNFLIGMDGVVYEGRGWLNVGAHTKGSNTRSIGVAFLGRFNRFLPSPAALDTFHKLMERGIELGHLAHDYQLYGARQLTDTESPGKSLYDVIVDWPHWTPTDKD